MLLQCYKTKPCRNREKTILTGKSVDNPPKQKYNSNGLVEFRELKQADTKTGTCLACLRNAKSSVARTQEEQNHRESCI